jgi:hypothetical protein
VGKKLSSATFAFLILFGNIRWAESRAATKAEIDALMQQIQKEEQSLQKMKQRVQELQGAPTTPEGTPTPTVNAQPQAPDVKPGEAPAPAEEEEAKMAKEGRLEPVPFEGNVDDKQEAAARPKGYTFDPKYRGYIPIPRTPFMIKFNPRPRVDLTFDSQNSGDNFRFVTAFIPLKGAPNHGGGEQFNANANGSQLRIDVRAPDLKGNFRFFYQNDFFGSDTANMRYRLQHLYGQYYGVTAGFTYGVFEDPDAWPDTLDYEGTNTTIFARRPLIHYTRSFSDTTNMTFGVEAPNDFVDTTGDPNASPHKRLPDMGFNFRWEPKGIGHLQFSAIVGSVGALSPLFGNQNKVSWGFNLGGAFNVSQRDLLTFLGVFGYGVGGMGNDTSFVNSDAAFEPNGNLKALRYFSGLFGYTHKWTPRFRSTLSYGYANLQNTGQQTGDAYHFTHYGSVNFIYTLLKRLHIGVEGLYGFKEVHDGRDGDVFRAQLSMMYSLFD